MGELLLRTNEIEVTIDPDHGAEILSLVEPSTGVDVMFSTPWRERAESVVRGEHHVISGDSQGRWLEQYRGGWQTLLPHAGPERVVDGATMGFHGEASMARWTVSEHSETEARLHCALFTVPLQVDRRVSVSGSTVTIVDELRNVATMDVRVDYVHHPAFGGPFLEGDVQIEVGARRFVPDGDTLDARLPGEQAYLWPTVADPERRTRPFDVVPPVGVAEVTFGTLVDFDAPWAQITNRSAGVAVRLDWDAEAMPYAWLWQEFAHSEGWPWFRRARVIAIEPSTTPTGGPDRESVLVVPALDQRTVEVRLTLQRIGGEG